MESTYQNYISLKIPSKSMNEKFVRDTIAEFAKQMAYIQEEDILRIKACVHSCLKNAIQYAYPTHEGEIVISATIRTAKVIEIKVQDFGEGIENFAEALRPLYAIKKGGSQSGFALIKKNANDIRIESAHGKGTTVIIWYRLKK